LGVVAQVAQDGEERVVAEIALGCHELPVRDVIFEFGDEDGLLLLVWLDE
jgi:hypothetical protein